MLPSNILRKFVVLNVFAGLLLLIPLSSFATMKYYGLQDLVGPMVESGYSGDESSVPNSSCGIFKIFSDGEIISQLHSYNTCGYILFQDLERAIIIKSAESTSMYSTNPKILAELQNLAESDESPKSPGDTEQPEKTDLPGETNFEKFLKNNYIYPIFQWVSIFSLSVSFVLFGLTASYCTRSNTIHNFSNTENVDVSSIVAIVYSFVCGSLIVCVFAGGFVQGSLFPSFTGDQKNFGFNSFSALKFRGPDWFKLAVWAFIAGFYERFIPDLLDRIKKTSEATVDNGSK